MPAEEQKNAGELLIRENAPALAPMMSTYGMCRPFRDNCINRKKQSFERFFEWRQKT